MSWVCEYCGSLNSGNASDSALVCQDCGSPRTRSHGSSFCAPAGASAPRKHSASQSHGTPALIRMLTALLLASLVLTAAMTWIYLSRIPDAPVQFTDNLTQYAALRSETNTFCENLERWLQTEEEELSKYPGNFPQNMAAFWELAQENVLKKIEEVNELWSTP